jgi:molybdopterin-containing oxidoreductase family iron-sulfur binding subunit
MSNDTGSPGVKRRDFLKVLGAAGATVGTVGCSSEKVGKLIPYLVSPDETVSGVSTYYATTCRECSAGCGIIAETRDGRTTKLEGNPGIRSIVAPSARVARPRCRGCTIRTDSAGRW